MPNVTDTWHAIIKTSKQVFRCIKTLYLLAYLAKWKIIYACNNVYAITLRTLKLQFPPRDVTCGGIWQCYDVTVPHVLGFRLCVN